MSRFWSPLVHTLTPYVPGEQPKIANLIKLNTNESPYGPSTRSLEAKKAATTDTLSLYPDPEALALLTESGQPSGQVADPVFISTCPH